MKPYEIPTMNDRMTLKPISIGPDESTAKALGLMLDHDIRQNWRVTEGGRKGVDVDQQQTVCDLMSRHPISVKGETLIHDAIKLMVQHKIGALPVVDADNRLVGILTEIDALQYCLLLIERYRLFVRR